MYKGIAYALFACFIWGLIFIVPQYMDGFSAIEIALGRYLVFGTASTIIFLRAFLQGSFRYPKAIWLQAMGYSLVTTIGYYTFVVLSLRFCSPAVCALVLGISPITIAFYGNWKNHEVSYSSLILPSILILTGLVMINVPKLLEHEAAPQYVLGLFCGVLALGSWSWFIVANSKFLHDNPQLKSSDWSTLLGVATLCWVGICSSILVLFFKEKLDMHKYLTASPELTGFVIGSVILGLLCSWTGLFLWNRASLYLPVSLAGQLTIFETIFGLVFVYTLDQHSPPLMEAGGIAMLIAAIIYGIRMSNKLHPITADN